VTRAWNEWLAGDRRRMPELYRRYTSALEAEEQAASALEVAIGGRVRQATEGDDLAPAARGGECDASHP
jgi:hypothetical protein